MDPNSGRIYPSLQAAYVAGVENPVEVKGRIEDIERMSEAIKAQRTLEVRADAAKAKRKAAKAARKANR